MTARSFPSDDPVITVGLYVTARDDHLLERSLTAVINPSDAQTWRRGEEAFPNRRRPDVPGRLFETSGWRVQVGPERSHDIEALITRLLSKVNEQDIRELATSDAFDVNIGVHIKMVEDTPDGSISASLLRRLADLNIGMDLDLYVVESGFTEAGLDD